jgi:hypothetical protein
MLKVEHPRSAWVSGCKFSREGGFAALSRPKQGYRRGPFEPLHDRFRKLFSRDHTLHYGNPIPIMQGV